MVKKIIFLASLVSVLCVGSALGDDEEKKPEGTGRGFEIWGIMINGIFDVALESREFHTNPFDGKFSLINYHHFVFLSRRKADEKFFFSAEIIGRNFYEFGAKLGRFTLKFGKVLIPFGADPLFHHYYGGLIGLEQKFVPFVWSEHGGVFTAKIFEDMKKRVIVSNDFFVVNAPEGDPTQVFVMSKASPSRFAVGDRLKIGYSRVIGYLSGYFTEYAKGYPMFMWGGDLSFARGFFPFLKNLSLKTGFAYMNVKGDPKKIGTYFNFADYLKIDYKLPLNLTFSFLVGSRTTQNYKYPFYDKSTPSKDDETAYNFALIYRRGPFSLTTRYVIKVEAIEQKDDFLRFHFKYEF